MNKNQEINQTEILLIDDTPEHIETSVAILKQNNFKVRIASKGNHAIKLIEQHKPDLILLDIYMPEMDGFDVCKIIKSNKDFNNIPIIFLTSSNDEESIKKGFELGAQDYVVKPFNASELLARVNTHIKLKQQTESLLEANHELDSFCYTVSHDLKSPLLSINKLIEYFDEDYKEKLDVNGIELLSNIREKSEEVIGIIDHLLEYSRMCELKINKEPINIYNMFNEVYNELTKLEPPRNIKFSIGDIPTINGDPVMIRLLICNILSNAIKYTRKKDAAIIEVSSYTNNSETVISVKDNGAGFNMMYSSRLFGVFQRLHSSSEFEGSGIGLSICNRIIKRHNGKVWMKGEVDKGAEFYFSIPND